MDAGCKVVGLLDFSDAALGPAGHEFISPVMHQFRGDLHVLQAFWEGAEVKVDNGELEHRAMARALLYYADTVGRYLERLPPPQPTSWSGAARSFWQLTTAAPAT
jgi:hypothetical protein